MSKYEELRREVLAKPAAKKTYEERFKEFLTASSLGELRRARELTQAQLADAMDTTQPGISRLERQADLYVRTLRSYIEAMGGSLEICAIFAQARVKIEAFESLDDDDPVEIRMESKDRQDA